MVERPGKANLAALTLPFITCSLSMPKTAGLVGKMGSFSTPQMAVKAGRDKTLVPLSPFLPYGLLIRIMDGLLDSKPLICAQPTVARLGKKGESKHLSKVSAKMRR